MLNSKGFDLWADGYDRDVGLSDEDNLYPFAGYRAVLGRIFDTVMQKSAPAVLDLGFGTAVLTSKLYERGCRVFGQDFSPRMVEIASEKMPEARLFCGDFTEGLCRELLENRYDFIIATYSLHHLTDEEKIPFIKKLLSLLNEGGSILIGDVAFEDRAALEACREDCGEGWDDEEYYFAADELKADFPSLEFEKCSHCAGVVRIRKEGCE
ncbi:MAG: class I SAM-dependent methyltransferase [Clostridia bacterium]|nr:class I SAM-dependent methyltransferase [Clostridia bacterium]